MAIDEPDSHRSSASPAKVVWTLAWPAVLLNSMQTVNALLDSFFIQKLPTANLTAISAATTVVFLFVSMTMALGTAATALVSRFFGANDLEGVVLANRKCVSLALIGGLACAALCWPMGFALSHVLLPPDPPEAKSLMLRYAVAFATGLPAIFVVQTLAGSLRGIGDTRSPMVISGVQICLHIALNALLINPSVTIGAVRLPGMGLGLLGAGIAVSLSAWVAAFLYLLWASRTPLGRSITEFWPGREWAGRILRIALPSATMLFVRVSSFMAFTWVLAQTPGGAVAIAALRPGFSVESFAFMPAFGLSIAAAALVGQSLGMGQPERASRLGWTAANHGGAVSMVASILLFTFAGPVANALIPGQPAVAAQVEAFTRFICLTEVLFGYGVVMTGALQGAGDTISPLYVTLFSMWGLRVPLAAVLAIALRMGATGCWISLTVSQAVAGVLAVHVFRRGKWKHKTV